MATTVVYTVTVYSVLFDVQAFYFTLQLMHVVNIYFTSNE